MQRQRVGLLAGAARVDRVLGKTGLKGKARKEWLDYLIAEVGLERWTKHKANELSMRMGVAWGGQVYDLVGTHMRSLKECPPRQKGGTLGIRAQ